MALHRSAHDNLDTNNQPNLNDTSISIDLGIPFTQDNSNFAKIQGALAGDQNLVGQKQTYVQRFSFQDQIGESKIPDQIIQNESIIDNT